MDIQNKPTLEQKQAFWKEQLPNFEAEYWLPSHFEFLVFDMDQGNYVIKDDLDPNFEDDAAEIWHRVNTGWAMWKKAISFSKTQAVLEGFAALPEIAKLYQVCKERDLTIAEREYLKGARYAWQAAKAQAIPEGFVLVPKDQVTIFWQDGDEPENFVSSESDFNSLGDCMDLGEIMEINKHTQANVKKERLYGTWFADVLFPSEKANFYVGTQEECNEIIAKNKAMIEAQEQGYENK